MCVCRFLAVHVYLDIGAFAAGPHQPILIVDLGRLGPDVYAALLEVWFQNGARKEKWDRVCVRR